MREGQTRNIDLMLFPELGISAYAIDDLLLQDALLDGVEAALKELVDASRELRPVFIVGAPVRRNGRLYNCGVVISRGISSASRPSRSCPITENTMRTAGLRLGLTQSDSMLRWRGKRRRLERT